MWRIPEQGFAQGEITLDVEPNGKGAAFSIIVTLGSQACRFDFDHSGRCVAAIKGFIPQAEQIG